jgi:hypothetical protein
MSDELSLTPKNQFIEDIKKWALLDSQLKIVNEKTRKMRDMKHDMSEKISKYMMENNLKEKKIKLSDGELRLYEKKEYSPLTFGYIEKTLANIINDKEQIEYVINYLKENRQINISSEIKRTYDK